MALSNIQLTPQFVQAVRDAVDVAEIASGYTKLARAGRKWKGLCPLHKEKTPSFNVDTELGFFKCFGCGEGGDAIKLHMLLTGDDFPAAMESLAERFGVPMPTRAAQHRGRRGEPQSDPGKALEAASEWFREQLARSAATRAYLEKRRIPQELVERFQLGYAPEGWRNLLRALAGRFSVGELLEVGLVARPDGDGEPYDRFRHRLVFPIRNAAGRLLGFGGRTLGDDVAKYLNTSETDRFRKKTLLYGLEHAKRTIRDGRRVFLVEGYLDVLAAVACGIENTVASMGTALTPEQGRLLARFADEVVLGYDGDEAGETACRRALPILLAQSLSVRRARLPEGEDPDSLRVSRGVAAVRALVDEADDFVRAELERLAPADLHRNPHARSSAGKGVIELLGAIPDAIVRYGYAGIAADRLGVPAQLVWKRLGGSRQELTAALDESAPAAAESGGGRERQALRILLRRLSEGETVELPDRLPPAEAFRMAAHREFFAAFLRLYQQSDKTPTLRMLREQVEGVEDASAILADLLIESADSPVEGELGEALRDLRLRWAKERRNELSRRMREAEGRDDHQLLERLLKEKKELELELFPAAPNAGYRS
jgi:DNA primase